MASEKPPKVFLDTSALFAGIWSESGGGRQILKLGEAGVIQLYCTGQVLSELEDAFREKAPDSLGKLALLIDASRIEMVGTIPARILKDVSQFVEYLPDAEILAGAVFANVDFFVTLDKKHFLSNKRLKNMPPVRIGSPGDFLVWFRGMLKSEDEQSH